MFSFCQSTCYIELKMAPFYLQGLLLFFIIVASECQANTVGTVLAFPEDDIALPCGNFNEKDLQSPDRIRWIKYSTDTSQDKVFLSWSKTSQDPKHGKWEFDEKGTKSLILHNSQKSDEGIYGCEICHGWDCILRNISLRVKDCKVLPSVKVAPSISIKLNCSVDIKEQEGSLNISWTLLKGGKPSPLIFERFEMNDTSLVIKSPSVSDSAWYRCSYTYGQIRRCFDIKILVQVEDAEVTTLQQVNRTKETKESGDTFTAAVASVITVAVVLAALIGVYIYWRRNTQRATLQTQGESEGAEMKYAYDYYEPLAFTRSDDTSNQQINCLYQQMEDDRPHTFSL